MKFCDRHGSHSVGRLVGVNRLRMSLPVRRNSTGEDSEASSRDH